MKLIIVGGVAGGASAAARARRLSEDAEIMLLERGPDVSFANCGLPYYVGGEITDRKKLLIVTPAQLRARFNLDVRTHSSVEAIDRAVKKVRIRDLVVRVFDLTAAMTGASEKVLRPAGRPFRKVYVHPTQHAGYYPGAVAMTLKLLFDPTNGKVLGAQAVGGAGVDKRIDVLAVAIQAGMTVFDLEEMELAYSPQYGSAKDPINMAGFVAGGLLRNDHPQFDVEEVLALSPSKRLLLIDVRTPQEFAVGHLPEAVNIPVDDLRSRMKEIARGRDIAVYCHVGQRGYLATRILRQAGFDVANIGGG